MRLTVILLMLSTLSSACAPRAATPTRDEDKGPAKATDFSLRSIDGRTVRLSDYLGRDVIFLNFWATWCVPCLGEMPALEKIHQTYKDQGLTILGVSMDGPESIANVEPTVRRYGITYPILLDEETRVVALYNPARDAPYSVLIDRQGRIVERFLGYSPGDEVKLEQRIQPLLAAGATESAP